MPKMSMNEVTTYHWSFLEDVTAYSKAGFDGIGVWRHKLLEFGEERAVELLRESGLSVSSLSWSGGFTGSQGYSFRESIEDARHAIRLAGEIGADCLVLVSGGRNGHIIRHSHRLVREALSELGTLAAEEQVELALQPTRPTLADNYSFLGSVDALLEIVAACDHPYVGMAFDVFHLGAEDDLVGRIGEMLPFVSTVKLSDAGVYPQSADDQLMLGEGQLPLSEIVEAFDRGGYDGFYEIGLCSEKAWKSDYESLIARCHSLFNQIFSEASKVNEPQTLPSSK